MYKFFTWRGVANTRGAGTGKCQTSHRSLQRRDPINQYRFFQTQNTPQHFSLIPKLPVITTMTQKAKKMPFTNLDKTAVFGVQHMLTTTPNWLKAIVDLGIQPHNMYFTGKAYSSDPTVERKVQDLGINLFQFPPHKRIGAYQQHARRNMRFMWEQALDDIAKKNIETIIIIDEGARAIENMPAFSRLEYKVAGIEQTRGGLYNGNLHTTVCPIISVASAAAKMQLESILIGINILHHVKTFIKHKLKPKTKYVFGIIGNGNIGSALIKFLLSEGHHVCVYDENATTFQKSANRLYRMSSVKTVFAQSDVIIGCTGKDCSRDQNFLEDMTGHKIILSASSEDKEFLSLLNEINKTSSDDYDVLSDITYSPHENAALNIVNGGFPINFNRKKETIAAKDIQLTRGLLFGAFLQALTVATKPADDGLTINSPRLLQLDPFMQKFVVDHWKTYQPEGRYPQSILDAFTSIDYIKDTSGGVYQPNKLLEEHFDEASPNFQEMPHSTFKC